MAPAAHDRTTKNLLNGLVITNVNGTNGTHTEVSANAEIDQALDGLVAHPSCPPFIVNRLIQRFVKSNPSRAYMTRVVNVFKNNGSGVRGDLKAVVKAILLDPEAWQPIRVQYLRPPVSKFVVTTMGTEDSRLQEPVLNYTRYMRFFKATSQYQLGETDGNTFVPDATNPVINAQFRLNSTDPTFDQSPYTMPSVFNFYNPDFQPPGDVTNYVSTSGRMQRSPAIFAPEFQIANAITNNNTGNFYRGLTANSRTENYLVRQISTNSTQYPTAATNSSISLAYSNNYENTANLTNVATKSTRTVVTFDYSTERNMLLLPANNTYVERLAAVDNVVNHVDLYLCGGTLTQSQKLSIRTAVLEEMNFAATGIYTSTGTGASDVSAAEVANIVRGVIMAIYASRVSW